MTCNYAKFPDRTAYFAPEHLDIAFVHMNAPKERKHVFLIQKTTMEYLIYWHDQQPNKSATKIKVRCGSQLSVVNNCFKWRHVPQRVLCYAKHKNNKAGSTTKSAAGPQRARDPKLRRQGFLLPHRCWPGVLSCLNQSCLLQPAPTWGERDKGGEVPRRAQHRLYNPLKGAVTWTTEHPSVMKVLFFFFTILIHTMFTFLHVNM